jgi:hypothetical protein
MRLFFFRPLFFLSLLPLFLCWIFPPPLAGQNLSDIHGDSFEEVEGRGLAIRTKPIGARVFIDGLERGQTPLILANLMSGEYHIRLEKEGYRERRFNLVLSASSRLIVSIEMEEAAGQVLFHLKKAGGSPPEEALPFRPVILAGGETIAAYPGTGDIPLVSLPAGYRTVQVRAFGWEDAVKTLYVREDRVTTADITLSPAAFALSGGTLSRARFNPANSGLLGTTEFRFEVSAPGRGSLTVKNREGRVVYRVALGPFQTWSQSAAWNGRDARGNLLPEGLYEVLVEAESLSWDGSAPVSQTLSLEVKIDPSANIYPLSLQGGISGLLFSPVPAALPPGSFQIEGSLFFGETVPGEQPFSTLPFDIGIRFSFLDRLELAGLLKGLPGFSGAASWGLTGSVKWVFLRDDEGAVPLGSAAGLSYTWEEKNAVPPGAGTGFGLYAPLSWRFNRLSLLLNPGIRWPVPLDLVSRPFLSGGVLYQGPWFIAGYSLKTEFNFSEAAGGGKDGNPLFLSSGGELKLYPPPSNWVFTLSGGFWFDGSRAGGFGGIGFGIIY